MGMGSLRLRGAYPSCLLLLLLGRPRLARSFTPARWRAFEFLFQTGWRIFFEAALRPPGGRWGVVTKLPVLGAPWAADRAYRPAAKSMLTRLGLGDGVQAGILAQLPKRNALRPEVGRRGIDALVFGGFRHVPYGSGFKVWPPEDKTWSIIVVALPAVREESLDFVGNAWLARFCSTRSNELARFCSKTFLISDALLDIVLSMLDT